MTTKENKVALVLRLVNYKKYRELYDLITNISKEDIGITDCSETPLELLKIIGGVRSHFHFLSLFGDEKNHVFVNEFHYVAYPKKFKEWLDLGVPGVSIEKLSEIASNLP